MALGGGFDCVLIISNKTNFSREGEAALLVGDDKPWETPWAVSRGALDLA